MWTSIDCIVHKFSTIAFQWTLACLMHSSYSNRISIGYLFSIKLYRPSPYVYFPLVLVTESAGKVFAMVSCCLSLWTSTKFFTWAWRSKSCMVHLLRTYTLSLCDGYKLEAKQLVTLRPKHGVPCTLVPRTWWPLYHMMILIFTCTFTTNDELLCCMIKIQALNKWDS